MSAPNVNDALVHLDDALHALTTEAWGCAVQADPLVDENWTRLPAVQATIAEELDLLDRALGRPKDSLIAAVGEAIRQAVIAIVAAKQSLGAA